MSGSAKKSFMSVAALTLLALGAHSAFALTLNDIKISAPKAVDIAMTKSAGGPATELEYKTNNKIAFYIVEFTAKSKKQEVKVDAMTGEILDVSESPAKNKPEVAVSLRKAITIAEQKTGGKTTEADLSSSKGAPIYKVETVYNKTKKQVKIDAQTGAVLSAEDD